MNKHACLHVHIRVYMQILQTWAWRCLFGPVLCGFVLTAHFPHLLAPKQTTVKVFVPTAEVCFGSGPCWTASKQESVTHPFSLLGNWFECSVLSVSACTVDAPKKPYERLHAWRGTDKFSSLKKGNRIRRNRQRILTETIWLFFNENQCF